MSTEWMHNGNRCHAAALFEADPTPCDGGPRDAVTVRGQSGGAIGCEHHAARLLSTTPGAWAVPGAHPVRRMLNDDTVDAYVTALDTALAAVGHPVEDWVTEDDDVYDVLITLASLPTGDLAQLRYHGGAVMLGIAEADGDGALWCDLAADETTPAGDVADQVRCVFASYAGTGTYPTSVPVSI